MRLLVYSCFVLSGVTGLVYEVVWGKYLSLFIGVSAYAHTIVLAAYMGGLALGSILFGWLADRHRTPLKTYALLQLGVGLYGALFPLLLHYTSRFYTATAVPDPGAAWNIVLKLVVSALLIVLPTTLMGGTLPVLTRYMARALPDVGRSVGMLYFVNSAGAAAGCVLAGFYFIRTFGLDASLMIAACVNCAIGVVCYAARKKTTEEPREAVRDQPVSPAAPPPPRFRENIIFVLVGLAGAVTMLYELVWIRLLSLVLGSSTYSFSLMLFTFISGIALGGLAASRILRRPRNTMLLFALCELGVFAVLLASHRLYDRLPFAFVSLSSLLARQPGAFALYHLLQVVLCFVVMIAPAVFIGMALPFASATPLRSMRLLGTDVGGVFASNTLGNVVGAILSGFVLIPALGLQTSIQAGIVASGLIGAFALASSGVCPRWCRAWHPAAATVAIFLTATLLVGRWDVAALNSGAFRLRNMQISSFDEYAEMAGDRILYAKDGPDMSVVVGCSRRDNKTRWLRVNGKVDASSGRDMNTQLLLGHLPMVLHPNPRDVLVIGLGSGVTAGSVLRHSVARCDIAELSRDVVEASGYFSHINNTPLEDARTQLYVADAREVLLLKPPAQYDIIISEPSNPWIAGIGNLFSVEFFEMARQALKPDGVLVQWMHVYEMDQEILTVSLNTLSSVFESVTVWSPQLGDIVLLASMRPIALDTTRLQKRLETCATWPEVEAQSSPYANITALLSLQVMGPDKFKEVFPGSGHLNTDRFPYLEYHAPRSFFVGQTAPLLRLDERPHVRSGSDLLIARYLGDRDITNHEMRTLLPVLRTRSANPSDRRLMHGLVYHAVHGAQAETTVSDSASREAHQFYLEYGNPGMHGNELMWKQRLAAGSLTPHEVRAYARFQAGLLVATTSVYHAPDTTPFSTALLHCVDSFPDERDSLLSMRNKIYTAIGLHESTGSR